MCLCNIIDPDKCICKEMPKLTKTQSYANNHVETIKYRIALYKQLNNDGVPHLTTAINELEYLLEMFS